MNNSDEIDTMTVLVIGQSSIHSRVGEMRSEYHFLAQNAESDNLLTFCDVQFLDINNLMDENIQLGHLSKINDADFLVCLNPFGSDLLVNNYQSLQDAMMTMQGISVAVHPLQKMEGTLTGKRNYYCNDVEVDGLKLLKPILKRLMFQDFMCIDYCDVYVLFSNRHGSKVQFMEGQYYYKNETEHNLQLQCQPFLNSIEDLNVDGILVIIHNFLNLSEVEALNQVLAKDKLKDIPIITTISSNCDKPQGLSIYTFYS